MFGKGSRKNRPAVQGRSVLPLLVAASQEKISPADHSRRLASSLLRGFQRLFQAGPREGQEAVWESGGFTSATVLGTLCSVDLVLDILWKLGGREWATL